MRKKRRYGLSLPVTLHVPIQKVSATRNGTTRDISTQGIYFLIDSDLKPSNQVKMTMTIPAEMTGGPDVFISVTGKVVRIEDFPQIKSKRIGVAATIDRYEVVRGDSVFS